MKRVLIISAFAVSSAVCLVCGEVTAATQTVGNYTWRYNINGEGAEICGQTSGSYSAAISPKPIGAVTIPSKLGGKPVTSIGILSFMDCTGLTSVTIPGSVTNIGSQAFVGCGELASVTIPDSVTSIGDSAFKGCNRLVSVAIGNGVKTILQSAFYDCTNLTTVTFGNCVTNIGWQAFYNCQSLASVTIPDSMTSIGGSAFYNCRGLTNVTIPDSVSTLGTGAFDSCPRLWAKWYRLLADGRGYDLTQTARDRAIADLAVSDDIALDSFVLKDGKVYDSVLYIHNNADHDVKVTLPANGTYKTFKGAKPLTLPAHSTNILTITRVARGNADGNVFFVMRQELETVQ